MVRGQVARHRVKIAVTTSGLPAQRAKVTDSPFSSVQLHLWLNRDVPARAAVAAGASWTSRTGGPGEIGAHPAARAQATAHAAPMPRRLRRAVIDDAPVRFRPPATPLARLLHKSWPEQDVAKYG